MPYINHFYLKFNIIKTIVVFKIIVLGSFMKLNLIFYFSFIFLFFGCAASKISPESLNEQNLRIIDTRTKAALTYDKFINELIKYDIVLIGELHENKAHQAAELKIINSLKKYKKLDVVFEMISSDKQAKIDAAKAAGTSKSDLENAIGWSKRWDYAFYQDLIESVFYSDANLTGGNLSKGEIDTIFNGAYPLNGHLSTTDEVKNNIKKIVTTMHEKDEIKDERLLEALVQIQQYKDRRMADKLVHSKNLAVLIAGKFHTDKNIGVPLHIMDFDTDKKFIVVTLGYEGEEPNSQEADFILLFKDIK